MFDLITIIHMIFRCEWKKLIIIKKDIRRRKGNMRKLTIIISYMNNDYETAQKNTIKIRKSRTINLRWEVIQVGYVT